jgi:hypothetical protein
MMATAELVVPVRDCRLEYMSRRGIRVMAKALQLTEIDTNDGTLNLSICRLKASESWCERLAQER